MKIFLSPAKRLNEKDTKKWAIHSIPKFSSESNNLMKVLSTKSPKELQDLMGISEDIANMNYERNQNWIHNPDNNTAYMAGKLFDGEVYRGFREQEFGSEELDYIQHHVFILSGLYGILSPTDLIMPYRLEMGTKLKTGNHKNLYSFWSEILTNHINENTSKDELLLNLASNEYIKAIIQRDLKGPLINFKFMDYKNGNLKQITVYMKKARGEMANWCIKNKAETMDDLKRFDRLNYQYDAHKSNDNTLVYTR